MTRCRWHVQSVRSSTKKIRWRFVSDDVAKRGGWCGARASVRGWFVGVRGDESNLAASGLVARRGSLLLLLLTRRLAAETECLGREHLWRGQGWIGRCQLARLLQKNGMAREGDERGLAGHRGRSLGQEGLLRMRRLREKGIHGGQQ